MNYKYKDLFWLLALSCAFCFDQLFWNKSFGINLFIFVVFALLGGLIPMWLGKIHIPWTSYVLLLPILGFAWMTSLRAEPLTTVMNVLITLGAMALFFMTLLNKDWVRFNMQEHLVNLIKFVGNCFSGGILFFTKLKREIPNEPAKVSIEKEDEAKTETDAVDNARKPHRFLPFLRGILLALPILLILTLLLTSADLIFQQRVQSLFSWFNSDKLGEYIFRFIYITILAYLLLSAYYFGLTKSKEIQKNDPSKPGYRPILGFIESWIILGSVNLLFLSFVLLQFTYLFGGEKNIHLEGFTYSEYAVRGYFELVAVVIITLILLYVMAVITRRKTNTQRWIFSGLGLLMVGLTGVILASAFTRLSLYETVYGFTRLRTMTHISILWMGLLLIAVIILEITRKTNRLPIVLICFIFSFGLTVNLVNIDKFIVQQNIARVTPITDDQSDIALDTGYLYSLSYDSLPPLVSAFTDPATPEKLRDEIGGVLACRLATLDISEEQPWSSTHFSRSQAISLLDEYKNRLEDYPVYENQGWFVEINGVIRSCDGNEFDEWDPD